ncbi:MAG: hypothetical protein EOO11_03360 [Chitinophagaceae bacterium]|nr:MAG: hypothetical protein EOO11_03360 [Chitinophagaceae bacterium]
MQVDASILKRISEELMSGFNVFLHRETSEVVTIRDTDLFMDEEDPWGDDRKKVDTERDMYLEFEPMESRDSYRMMQDFINQLDDARLADRLANAIEKKRPFAHFKAEIDNSGPYREKWFQFRDQSYLEWAKEQWEAQLQ